jgi:hypothetical protein
MTMTASVRLVTARVCPAGDGRATQLDRAGEHRLDSSGRVTGLLLAGDRSNGCGLLAVASVRAAITSQPHGYNCGMQVIGRLDESMRATGALGGV